MAQIVLLTVALGFGPILLLWKYRLVVLRELDAAIHERGTGRGFRKFRMVIGLTTVMRRHCVYRRRRAERYAGEEERPHNSGKADDHSEFSKATPCASFM